MSGDITLLFPVDLGLTNWLYVAESFLRSQQVLSCSRYSLLHSQEPFTCPILSKINQFHAPIPPFEDLILPSHLLLGLRSLSLSLWFPHQNPVCTFVPHISYLHSSSRSSWFDHADNIWWEVQIFKFLVIWPSPLSCYIVPLTPQRPPVLPVLKSPRPTFLPQCEWPSVTPIQNNRKN
jgi:hypothetical protein